MEDHLFKFSQHSIDSTYDLAHPLSNDDYSETDGPDAKTLSDVPASVVDASLATLTHDRLERNTDNGMAKRDNPGSQTLLDDLIDEVALALLA